MHPKPSRVRRMRTFAVSFLFLAGIVNYLDRTSFSFANTSVRADLGLSGTQIGALLSAFSLAYGVVRGSRSRIPDGVADRFQYAGGNAGSSHIDSDHAVLWMASDVCKCRTV
jgi:sugar phosphate permease